MYLAGVFPFGGIKKEKNVGSFTGKKKKKRHQLSRRKPFPGRLRLRVSPPLGPRDGGKTFFVSDGRARVSVGFPLVSVGFSLGFRWVFLGFWRPFCLSYGLDRFESFAISKSFLKKWCFSQAFVGELLISTCLKKMASPHFPLSGAFQISVSFKFETLEGQANPLAKAKHLFKKVFGCFYYLRPEQTTKNIH